MAKVKAFIAGRQYSFESEPDEASMLAVIEEANRRITSVRATASVSGEREQILIAFLDALAERMYSETVPESDADRVSLEARLAYLESALDYSRQLGRLIHKHEENKRSKRSRRRPKKNKTDFISRQIELEI